MGPEGEPSTGTVHTGVVGLTKREIGRRPGGIYRQSRVQIVGEEAFTKTGKGSDPTPEETRGLGEYRGVVPCVVQSSRLTPDGGGTLTDEELPS